MVSDLTLARAAFAQSRTPAEALLTVAKAHLQMDNANIAAGNRALTTGASPDLVAAQQAVLEALTAHPLLDKTA